MVLVLFGEGDFCGDVCCLGWCGWGVDVVGGWCVVMSFVCGGLFFFVWFGVSWCFCGGWDGSWCWMCFDYVYIVCFYLGVEFFGGYVFVVLVYVKVLWCVVEFGLWFVGCWIVWFDCWCIWYCFGDVLVVINVQVLQYLVQ